MKITPREKGAVGFHPLYLLFLRENEGLLAFYDDRKYVSVRRLERERSQPRSLGSLIPVAACKTELSERGWSGTRALLNPPLHPRKKSEKACGRA